MEGHSTRVCELCGTLYPPDVEWCPADGELTVAAMIVRAAPSARNTPQAPTRLANNFRPPLNRSPAVPARFASQLPEQDFVDDPRPFPEEETSIRIPVPQPRAVYSESSQYLKAPVLTALREMRSFSEDELKETPSHRPQDQTSDEEFATAVHPRRDHAEDLTRIRPPKRQTPIPAPQQSRRDPKFTQPEIELAKAPLIGPRSVSALSPQAEATMVAITTEKTIAEKLEEETTIAALSVKKAEPKNLSPIIPLQGGRRIELKPPEKVALSFSVSAVPLAYAEPKASLLTRLRGWFWDGFVPWLTELKESAILRLLLLVAVLILFSIGLLALVQLL
jgi:hypothetical protein